MGGKFHHGQVQFLLRNTRFWNWLYFTIEQNFAGAVYLAYPPSKVARTSSSSRCSIILLPGSIPWPRSAPLRCSIFTTTKSNGFLVWIRSHLFEYWCWERIGIRRTLWIYEFLFTISCLFQVKKYGRARISTEPRHFGPARQSDWSTNWSFPS